MSSIGVEGFFCIVRACTIFDAEPYWFFTSDALRDYMPIAVGNRWDHHRLGPRLESFAIAGGDVLGKVYFCVNLFQLNICRCDAHRKRQGSIPSKVNKYAA